MIARATYLFLLFSCLSVFNTHGQISIKTLSLSNLDTNQLYIGVTNHLKVTGVSQGQVKLSSKFCGIERINENEFNVRAYRISEDTFTVSKNGKPIFTKSFSISRIPDPKICVAKRYTTDASIEDILSDPALYFVVPNCMYVHNVTVWSFAGAFITQNGNIIKPSVLKQTGSLKIR